MKKIANPLKKMLGWLWGGKIVLRTTLTIGVLFVASMLLVQAAAGWYCLDQNGQNTREYRDGKFSQISEAFTERTRIGREILSRLSNIPTVLEFQYRDRITIDNYKKTSALLQYINMIELSNPGIFVYVYFPRSRCVFGSEGWYAASPVTEGSYILFSDGSSSEQQDGYRFVSGVTVTTDRESYGANLLVMESDRVVIRAVYPLEQQNELLMTALLDDSSLGAVLGENCAALACTPSLALPAGCESPEALVAALNGGELGRQYDFEGRYDTDGRYIVIGFNRNTPLNKNIRNNRYYAIINIISLSCMLVWLLLFSHKVFWPIRNITTKIKSLQGSPARDEFNLIGALIDSMDSRIRNLNTELNDHHDLFMENMINRLAAGSDIPCSAADEFGAKPYVILTLVCERDGVECGEDVGRFEDMLGIKFEYRRFKKISKQWSYYVQTDTGSIDDIVGMASEPGYGGFLVLGISKAHHDVRELRDALEESRRVFNMPLKNTEAAGRMIYRCGNDPAPRSALRISAQEENALLGHVFRGDEVGAKEIFDEIHKNNSGLSIGQQREIYMYLVNLLYIYGRQYSIFPVANTNFLDSIEATYDPAMMNRIVFHEYHKVADVFKTDESILGKIVAYINANYSKRINLRQITDEMNVSYTHISRLFNQKLGISFPDYLNQLRIERAKVLIIKTNDPIGAISEHVGFDLVNTFNRIFKKHTGMTPGDWRKLHPEDNEAVN